MFARTPVCTLPRSQVPTWPLTCPRLHTRRGCSWSSRCNKCGVCASHPPSSSSSGVEARAGQALSAAMALLPTLQHPTVVQLPHGRLTWRRCLAVQGCVRGRAVCASPPAVRMGTSSSRRRWGC